MSPRSVVPGPLLAPPSPLLLSDPRPLELCPPAAQVWGISRAHHAWRWKHVEWGMPGERHSHCKAAQESRGPPQACSFLEKGNSKGSCPGLGVGRTALGAPEPATRDCQSRLVSLNSGYTLTSQFFLPSPRPPFPSMKSWAPRLRKAHRFIAY